MHTVQSEDICFVLQYRVLEHQRSAMIKTNAITDRATVDHPPPYDQLKNTSSSQFLKVYTSRAMMIHTAAREKHNVKLLRPVHTYFSN